MTKEELVKNLTRGANRKDLVNELIELIVSTVASNQEVSIFGLGKFVPTIQKGKSGTIPGSTKTYKTNDKLVPKFKPAKQFKDRVASGK